MVPGRFPKRVSNNARGRDSYLVPVLSEMANPHSISSSGPRERIPADVGARRDSRTSWTMPFLNALGAPHAVRGMLVDGAWKRNQAGLRTSVGAG